MISVSGEGTALRVDAPSCTGNRINISLLIRISGGQRFLHGEKFFFRSVLRKKESFALLKVNSYASTKTKIYSPGENKSFRSVFVTVLAQGPGSRGLSEVGCVWCKDEAQRQLLATTIHVWGFRSLHFHAIPCCLHHSICHPGCIFTSRPAILHFSVLYSTDIAMPWILIDSLQLCTCPLLFS